MAVTFAGHRVGYEATESGRRWVGKCSCGWVSSTRRTEMEGMAVVLHHVKKLRAEYSRNGVSTPRVEPGGTLYGIGT